MSIPTLSVTDHAWGRLDSWIPHPFGDHELEAAYRHASVQRILPILRVATVVTGVALPVYWLWDRDVLGADGSTLVIRSVAALGMLAVFGLTFTSARRRPTVILALGYGVVTTANAMALASLDGFVEGQAAFVIGPVLAAIVAPRLFDLAVINAVALGIPVGVMAWVGASNQLSTVVPWFLLGSAFGAATWLVVDRAQRQLFLSERALEMESQRSEKLLLNVLPAQVAERLKEGQDVAQASESVTVLFADIAGFTTSTRGQDPSDVLDLLNDVFGSFDDLALAYGVEKIKTIGDGWMAACGMWGEADHAARIVALSQDMHAEMRRFAGRRGHDWSVRIGVHTGPVASGVVGRTKFVFDIWGDTVNVASRLEAQGEPGRTQLSGDTARLLQHDGAGPLPLRVVRLRGQGDCDAIWLDEVNSGTLDRSVGTIRRVSRRSP